VLSSTDERADLDSWVAWLDEQRVEHSGVVFRDPDNILLELIHMPT
jgi:hypothetical protein